MCLSRVVTAFVTRRCGCSSNDIFFFFFFTRIGTKQPMTYILFQRIDFCVASENKLPSHSRKGCPTYRDQISFDFLGET